MFRPISVHVLTFVTLLSTPAAAQIVPGPMTLRVCDSNSESHNEFFRHRSFFNPLIADIRAPQIAFNFPAFTDAFPHSVKPGVRRIWDVSVGREVPIMARSNFTEGTIGKNCSGWGIWVDLSFHVLEELGKDDSNPIINTDYRFSL